MRTASEATPTAQPRPLIVGRTYAVKREVVFGAWTSVDAVKRWFCPTGYTVPEATVDARVGGRFTFVDRRPDMGEVLHTGEYLEIDRPRRLVFRFSVPAFSAGTTTIRVEITPTAEGCELILTHEGVLEDYAERTVDGWTMILEALDRALRYPPRNSAVASMASTRPRRSIWTPRSGRNLATRRSVIGSWRCAHKKRAC